MTPQYEDILVATHNQRLWHAWVATLGLAVILAGTCFWLTFKPAPPPWVLAVNNEGQPIARMMPLPGTAGVADKAIRYAIEQYLTSAFGVSRDFETEKGLLQVVYGMSTDAVGKHITSWYGQGPNNPEKLSAKVHQDVTVEQVIKYPDKDVYEAHFRTERYENIDGPASATEWRAFLRVQEGEPTAANPLGLFIANIDFQQEAGK